MARRQDGPDPKEAALAGAPTCRSGLGSASGPGVGISGWAPAVGPLAAGLAITSSVTITRTRRRTRPSRAQPSTPRLNAAARGRAWWLA